MGHRHSPAMYSHIVFYVLSLYYSANAMFFPPFTLPLHLIWGISPFTASGTSWPLLINPFIREHSAGSGRIRRLSDSNRPVLTFSEEAFSPSPRG